MAQLGDDASEKLRTVLLSHPQSLTVDFQLEQIGGFAFCSGGKLNAYAQRIPFDGAESTPTALVSGTPRLTSSRGARSYRFVVVLLCCPGGSVGRKQRRRRFCFFCFFFFSFSSDSSMCFFLFLLRHPRARVRDAARHYAWGGVDWSV